MRACLFGFLFALCLGSALALATPQVTPRPELETVLDRAGWYLDYFVDEFENVVAEETYTQDSSQLLSSFSPISGGRGGAVQPSPSDMLRARHRDLRSDFLLVKSPDTEALVPFRDVIQVDGHPVRDREARPPGPSPVVPGDRAFVDRPVGVGDDLLAHRGDLPQLATDRVEQLTGGGVADPPAESAHLGDEEVTPFLGREHRLRLADSLTDDAHDHTVEHARRTPDDVEVPVGDRVIAARADRDPLVGGHRA